MRSIVSYDLFGNTEAADDVLLDEVFDFSVVDLMVCLSFYPLGEVVCDCEHVYTLAGYCRKLSHNVHFPLHEGPWRKDGSKLFGWKVRDQGEALATVAAFDMAGRVRAHGWPVVACGEGSVSKAASTRVLFTLTLVKF